MFDYTVTFRLDEMAEPARDDPAWNAWRERWCGPENDAWRRAAAERLGLRIVSFAWHALSLSKPEDLARFEGVLAAVDRGEVHIGSLYVGQKLAAPEQATHFLLDGSASDGEAQMVLDRGDYPTVNAAAVADKHRLFEGVYVAESVWRVLRTVSPEADMLWLKDRGRYAARQWYFVNPEPCAGRGVAHEWLARDAPAYDVELSASQVRKRQLRPDWSRFGDPPASLTRAVECAGDANLSFPPAFLSSQLPDAPLSRATSPFPSVQGILCTRAVRAALLKARVLRPAEFYAVRVVERDAETIDLDAAVGDLPPLVPRERFNAWRAQSSLLRAFHDDNPKPARSPNLEKLLSAVRRLKRESDGFAPGAKGKRVAKVEAELQVGFPEAFKRLLSVTAGAPIWVGDHELDLWQLETLPTAHQSALADVEASGDPAPPWLFFGSNAGGDTYALDLTSAPVDDAPVVLVSHETAQEEQRWSSVPAFLHWLLHEG